MEIPKELRMQNNHEKKALKKQTNKDLQKMEIYR